MVSFQCQSQITLGTREAVLDSLTGNWLCSIPEDCFGGGFEATISSKDSLWTSVTIDGQAVELGTSFTFEQVAGDKHYAIQAFCGDSLVAQGDLCFTFLPIFELFGEFNDDYQITNTIAHLPENQAPMDMLSKVKHRGGTTNRPGRQKRNYHIKFINPDDSSKMDRKFFGLRNDNSWLLDAGQIDLLRIRNRVCTELWLEMSRAPYYADVEPNALTGVRGDFIEVFLNGKYRGMYALTEAMDRKQFKLAKYDEQDSLSRFHGMLWKTKDTSPIVRMLKSTFWSSSNNYPNWDYFYVKYPDPDDVMPTDYTTLHDAVEFVAHSNYAEFKEHVAEYFDIPLVMDYWIFINAINAIDNVAKNMYWAVYDQTEDKKLTLGVWDLDCTFGQNWTNNPIHNPDVVGPERPLSTLSNLFMRLNESNPDAYAVKARNRYLELRKTLLSEESLKARFRERIEHLNKSGVIQRETQRWSGNSDISYHPLDFDAELAYIENWIDQHMAFLDNGRFRPYIMGDSNRDGNIDIADLNQIITEILRGDNPIWYEDMNQDGLLDIADVNLLINAILSGDSNTDDQRLSPRFE